MFKSKIHIISYLISLVLVLFIGKYIFDYYYLDSNNRTSKIDKNINLSNPDDIILGSPNAPISVYMYGNYKCPYCSKFMKLDIPKLLKYYKGKVKFVLKVVPYTKSKDELNAYKMALAVYKYGNYQAFHKFLLKNADVIYSNKFVDYMDEIMSRNEAIAQFYYKKDADKSIIENNDFFNKMNFKGTPTFVIMNKVIRGYKSVEKFKKILQLKDKG